MTAKFRSTLRRICLALAGLAAAALPASAQSASSYLIGPRDLVDIQVFQQPSLSAQARVQSDQSVFLPVIGNVVIGGMDEPSAARAIAAALETGGVVRDAAVTVRVIEFASQRISVLGYVGSPGSYILDRPSTISDLLAKAGGATPDAGDTLVFTDRPIGAGTIERIELNIQDLLGGADASIDRPVSDGDTIFVPRAPVFYIYGEVRSPGTFRVEPGLTVEQALATAGGATELGKSNKIKRRDMQSGKLVSAELTDIVKGGDVFYLPQSLF
ncbi:SLBB domain-containing protein [Pseudokordiimonas caeni]|uniref:SLBB domain-containing protein n=1 Tax=Pseudokordiimonas caeni TaxID=2997908 RepID=UPI0028122A5D|nr:SLBB domain-containing protein [Pseudokordiimonas caeni]